MHWIKTLSAVLFAGCQFIPGNPGTQDTVPELACIPTQARLESRLYQTQFDPDRKEGLFCLSYYSDRGEHRSCYQLRLTDSRYELFKHRTLKPEHEQEIDEQPNHTIPARIQASQRAYDSRVIGRTLSICQPGGVNCKTYELPVEYTSGYFHNVPVEAIALHDAVASELIIIDAARYQSTNQGIIVPVHVYDKSAKMIRSFKIQNMSDLSASTFGIIGNVLYVRNCVGAGPGCQADFFSLKDGARIHESLALDLPNMYGGHELQLSQHEWLFISGDGLQLNRVNSRTMQSLAQLKLAESMDPSLEAEIALSADKQRLWIISVAPRTGDLIEVDLRNHRVDRRYSAPICSSK